MDDDITCVIRLSLLMNHLDCHPCPDTAWTFSNFVANTSQCVSMLCLTGRCSMQAGVDLGTVLEDHKAASGRKGARSRAVELRPKRRAPISQVPSRCSPACTIPPQGVLCIPVRAQCASALACS